MLCAAYKVLTNVIRRRLEPSVENILGEYQSGFRAGRSTTDQLFTVKTDPGKVFGIQYKCIPNIC
jgi:sorting nexin-29